MNPNNFGEFLIFYKFRATLRRLGLDFDISRKERFEDLMHSVIALEDLDVDL